MYSLVSHYYPVSMDIRLNHMYVCAISSENYNANGVTKKQCSCAGNTVHVQSTHIHVRKIFREGNFCWYTSQQKSTTAKLLVNN